MKGETAGGDRRRRRRDARRACAASRTRRAARRRHLRHRRRRPRHLQHLDRRGAGRRGRRACRSPSTATARSPVALGQRRRARRARRRRSRSTPELAGARARRDRHRLPLRAAAPPGDARGDAGAPRARRAHGLQPARPAHQPGRRAPQVLGVYARDRVELLARVLAELGCDHALVVHGRRARRDHHHRRPPSSPRCATARCAATSSRRRSSGCAACRSRLSPAAPGGERRAHGGAARRRAARTRWRDVVALNAGAALYVGGRAADSPRGRRAARALLAAGAAARQARRAEGVPMTAGEPRPVKTTGRRRRHPAAHRRARGGGGWRRVGGGGELPSPEKAAVAARRRRRTPSSPRSPRSAAAPSSPRSSWARRAWARCAASSTRERQARTYAEARRGGALGGGRARLLLRQLRAAARLPAGSSGLPAIAKDFVVDPLQLDWAKDAGADAILLIAALYDAEELRGYAAAARAARPGAAGRDPRPRRRWSRSPARDWELVGVNNRDLRTFEVDLEHSIALGRDAAHRALKVAESGIAVPPPTSHGSAPPASTPSWSASALLADARPGPRRCGSCCA